MSNKLANSTSPYLLQHANNPVHWQPWSDDIFKTAQKENKMLFISIGYAACHWCHVMERESFTNTEIANLINKYFIPVKIDREERPDVDQIYMNAVQIINGQGGWPLSCFALPDGSPFFGGTYFPPTEFQGVLQSLAATWMKESYRILNAANQVKEGLVKTDIIKQDTKNHEKPDEAFLHEFVSSWEFQFDTYWGGNSGAPKFPLPSSLSFLLNYGVRFTAKNITDHLQLTTTRMMQGGIYDHIGGGFARYATDKKWRTPHFEKMLYDNAQMLSLLSDLYKHKPSSELKNAIFKTVAFLKHEMLADNHGFYASLDADSEGEEGKYYVWSWQEINDALRQDADLFADYYNITKQGNQGKGKNVLFTETPLAAVCSRHGIPLSKAEERIRHSLKTLSKIRETRTKPALDTKQLVSWNALTIEGLLNAFQAVGEQQWLNMATNAGNFLLKQAMKDGELMRNARNDKHAIPGLIDDYAFTIRAMIKLFETTAEEKWLETARLLLSYTLENFKDPDSAMFFQTKQQNAPLGIRKMEIMDNVMPSANSVMAQNLFLFSIITAKNQYREQALQMLQNMKPKIQHHGPFYSNWMQLWLWFVKAPYELVVSGPKAASKTRQLQQHYLPAILQVWSDHESDLPVFKYRYSPNETRIFICQNNTCQKPLTIVEDALESMEINADNHKI
ncbi:MAG: thioredoxin domain-containing protein [Bacteroidota bacterium]